MRNKLLSAKAGRAWLAATAFLSAVAPVRAQHRFDDLQPALNVRVEFGSGHPHRLALRFAAQLDLRAAGVPIVHEPSRRTKRVVTDTPLDALLEPRALPLFQIALDRDQITVMRFMGRKPRAPDRLNETGIEAAPKPLTGVIGWGAVGAVAIVAIAVGGHGGGADGNPPAADASGSAQTWQDPCQSQDPGVFAGDQCVTDPPPTPGTCVGDTCSP